MKMAASTRTASLEKTSGDFPSPPQVEHVWCRGAVGPDIVLALAVAPHLQEAVPLKDRARDGTIMTGAEKENELNPRKAHLCMHILCFRSFTILIFSFSHIKFCLCMPYAQYFIGISGNLQYLVRQLCSFIAEWKPCTITLLALHGGNHL